MYDDLTHEQAVELALEHLMRQVPVPDKLRAVIGEDDMEVIEGLYNADD